VKLFQRALHAEEAIATNDQLSSAQPAANITTTTFHELLYFYQSKI
jgi:hypothetical protein